MRFRKRVKVFPGFYLNFSNSGISSTVGVRGASISFGKRGTYLNTSIPGTGLSHRQRIGGPGRSANSNSIGWNNKSRYNNSPFPLGSSSTSTEIALEGEIKSADKDQLTSTSMREMQDTIEEAFQDRIEIASEIVTIEQKLRNARVLSIIANVLIIGFAVRWFKENVYEKEDYIIDLQTQLSNSKVDVDVTLTPDLKCGFERLKDSFSMLCKSEIIWDITSSKAQDSVATRSAATSAITRTKVLFNFENIDVINSQFTPLHLQNANGDDLYLYPAFVVITKSKTTFVLIDICDLNLTFVTQNFVEEERIPGDTTRIGETWAKVDKNGQPDRRFKGNYQIPIVKYGQINLKTNNGLNEAYSFSNHSSAEKFVGVFNDYQEQVKSISL